MSDNDIQKYAGLPFPLAYLDWCKDNGIKKIEDTENRDRIRVFYKEVWEPLGKDVNGLEYGIALGLPK